MWVRCHDRVEGGGDDDRGGDDEVVAHHLCEDPVEPLQGPVQVKLW